MTANDPNTTQSETVTAAEWKQAQTTTQKALRRWFTAKHFYSSLKTLLENLPQHYSHHQHHIRAIQSPHHLLHTWAVRCLCCRFTQLDCADPGWLKTLAFFLPVINLSGRRGTSNPSSQLCNWFYRVCISAIILKVSYSGEENNLN